MKVLNIIFLVSLTFLTMSCALLSIDYDYDRDANFARLRTFDWLPVELPEHALVIEHITETVNRELEAKGFMKNQKNPDFLVVISGRKVKKKGVLSYVRRRRSHRVRRYEEATYTIAILDTQSKEFIWRGTARRQYDDDPPLFSGMDKRRQQNYNMLLKILNNFPPPKK